MEARRRPLTIRYIEGDATHPAGAGMKIVVHVCNDIGKWGKGFVLAVSRRWIEPERAYREAFKQSPPPALGDVQFVRVSINIAVANLIGQHGIATGAGGTPPIRYEAIRAGLMKIAAQALAEKASVHMPRIGCGLAGGDWARVEPIIIESLVDQGVEVTVYDYTQR
jgi:O-acetyl-ADP-ribose deacetylase (regulator of RNase III)